jgi:FAD/FMN-containing dehydrogenase
MWSNWSGSLEVSPGWFERPRDEEDLARIVGRAAERGDTVRVVGSGHSSSPLVDTTGVMVSLEHFREVHPYDPERCEAIVGGGVTLNDAGAALKDLGMGFMNLGDIDSQTVAGAFSTGTHGTGVHLPILAHQLIGGRVITGAGEIVEFGIEQDPELVQAMRVSLGALGILTSLRLRLVPAYRVRKREWCTRIDDCLERFDDLSAQSRQVDFYWYPRSDEAKIRTTDLEELPPPDVPSARLVADETGWSNETIPNARELRFEEMEYALPAEAGMACFQEVRQRVLERWRHLVGWRVLYRTIAADDADLSIAHGRRSVTISLHQNATLPYQEYFADIEPIFRAHGGRPHWGKKHGLLAPELRPLYPKWDDFQDLRKQMDPADVFLSPYLRELLSVS